MSALFVREKKNTANELLKQIVGGGKLSALREEEEGHGRKHPPEAEYCLAHQENTSGGWLIFWSVGRSVGPNFVFRTICLSSYSTYLSEWYIVLYNPSCPPVSQLVGLSVCLSVCRSVGRSVGLSVCLSVCLPDK